MKLSHRAPTPFDCLGKEARRSRGSNQSSRNHQAGIMTWLSEAWRYYVYRARAEADTKKTRPRKAPPLQWVKRKIRVGTLASSSTCSLVFAQLQIIVSNVVLRLCFSSCRRLQALTEQLHISNYMMSSCSTADKDVDVTAQSSAVPGHRRERLKRLCSP